MAMLVVDGVAIKDPTGMTWGLNDVSASNSGRTQDALMHKNRVAQKRKLTLEWDGLTWEQASPILLAFNPQYISVQYPDAMTGTRVTKTFYVGDRSAPYKMWTVDKKIFSKLSFDIIER